ncbi:hypothetical protein F4825DRAFT_420928 [Nemania diffusa]|nr:hypothetical protein F4825DRAFT_420928 [Nemania diffusa]
MCNSLRPFSLSIVNIISPDAFEVVLFVNQQGPPQKPLQPWPTKELLLADVEFIRRS